MPHFEECGRSFSDMSDFIISNTFVFIKRDLGNNDNCGRPLEQIRMKQLYTDNWVNDITIKSTNSICSINFGRPFKCYN
jgi:hypothetical protein